jgi:hypothetical protein
MEKSWGNERRRDPVRKERVEHPQIIHPERNEPLDPCVPRKKSGQSVTHPLEILLTFNNILKYREIGLPCILANILDIIGSWAKNSRNISKGE